jgi:hypothetical protein
MTHKKKPPRDFTLSHRALEKIFAAWQIPLAGDGLVLFAFRGCLPTATHDGWRKSLRLRPAVVDHLHMRCTLGIWDRAGKRIFAAPGSTVPHKHHVLKAAARQGMAKGKGVNQMEPGFYTDFSKGEHLQGKVNGHQALRQTASRFYRRSRSGLPYTAGSPLYYGNPYDNLHCGWNADGRKPGFSSAGCLVVAGLPHCPRQAAPVPNQGPWRTFHALLYGASQTGFPLLLLPAREVRECLASGSEGRNGPRLVFGSAGEAVRGLQRRLAKRGRYRGGATGRLDARTYKAWKLRAGG